MTSTGYTSEQEARIAKLMNLYADLRSCCAALHRETEITQRRFLLGKLQTDLSAFERIVPRKILDRLDVSLESMRGYLAKQLKATN